MSFTRVLIAPDKYKGTLTAQQAAQAIEEGVRRANPEAQCTLLPLADGGEGFTASLAAAFGVALHSIATVDALGRPCVAQWADLGRGVASFDISSASGLTSVPPALRDPRFTSTYGSGLVLRELIARGFHKIFIGLGGSATNDAGIGIAAALGFRFLDSNAQPVMLQGAALQSIAAIESPASAPKIRIVIATDVANPLCGENGAARQFASQKGASEAAIAALDAGLEHFASIVHRYVGKDFAETEGAGAAGGAGFGLMALLAAEQCSGFDILSAHWGLAALIDAHDLIITGEGAFDRTSLLGKAPLKLAELARATERRVYGVFGRCEVDVGRYFDRYAAMGEAPESLSEHDHRARLACCVFDLLTRK